MVDVSNGIAAHYLNTAHSIAWEKATMMDRETNWHRRRIKEVIRIQKCQVRMNLDQGLKIHQSWKRFNFHVTGSKKRQEKLSIKTPGANHQFTKEDPEGRNVWRRR